MPLGKEIVPTNCRLCGYLCGLLAHIEAGQIVKLEPDPSRYPYDPGIVRGCRRCQSNLQILDHSQRINYPLKRVGERGGGSWMRITWDQALDEIALCLGKLKERFGPETLSTSIGGPHAVYWPLHRFMNLFGSPNNIGIGQICWNPAIWINTITFGWPIEYELVPELTKTAIIWGMNPAESDNSLFWRTVLEYSRTDGELIVVDPRRTRTAKRADHWLPIRPGWDAALAMGMLHVIIEEKRYNQEFVRDWCYGFDKLVRKVKYYDLHVVSELTGIEPEMITRIARLFADHSPATIITGRGIDQIGHNSIPAHRAIAILRAITGNVDLPGASHLTEMPDFHPEIDLELSDLLPAVQKNKQLGGEHLLLQTYVGYDLVRRETEKAGKRLPMRYMTSAHPNLVWQAMLYGYPYPIRAMVVMGSNPLLSQADTRLVYQALKSLDLLVSLELHLTPTAMLADYILPIAGGLERPVLQTNAGTANIAYGGPAAVVPLFERRTDFDFWRQLGVRMGQAEYWSWECFEESMDATFQPLGITWKEFCEDGLYAPPPEYQKYLKIDLSSDAPVGFSTPSGKIELYSQLLDELGGDPLPSPKRIKKQKNGYPLQLITGARKQPYYASAFRQVDELREIHPIPQAEIGPKTAVKLGLKDGDMIWVETQNGRAQFQTKISEMLEEVISVEYGWWYPEIPNHEPRLGGVLLSNANLLTNADFFDCEPLLGQWKYNGIPCLAYPLHRDEDQITEGSSSFTIYEPILQVASNKNGE